MSKPIIPSKPIASIKPKFVETPDINLTELQPMKSEKFVSVNNPNVDRDKIDNDLIPRQLRSLLKSIENSGYTLPNTDQFFNLKYSELKNTIQTAELVDGKMYESQTTPEYQKNLIHNPNGMGRGFSRPGKPDTINSLYVIDGNTFDTKYNQSSKDTKDIIAFYFHDLVNDRYIPFRATVKGINEQAAAEWSDISYIGRADKLFNYKGFSRQLNFSFVVVASSYWNCYQCGPVLIIWSHV